MRTRIEHLGLRAVLWLLAGGFIPSGFSLELVEELSIEPPLAFELNPQGQVVWKLAEPQHFLSVKADSEGRRMVAFWGGRVLIYSASGEPARTLNTPFPADADFLENGNILLTSVTEGSVKEFDSEGRVVWEYGGLKQPRDADRLADGSTLICDTGGNRVIEVDALGEVSWVFSRGLKHPYDADVVDEESIVIADYDNGSVACVDRGKKYRWRFNGLIHPNEVHPFPDGSFLVSESESGILLSISGSGKMLKRWILRPRIEDFSLTPNGNLMVAVWKPSRPVEPATASADLAEIPQSYVSVPLPAAREVNTVEWAPLLTIVGVLLLAVILYSLRIWLLRRWRLVAALLVSAAAVGAAVYWRGQRMTLAEGPQQKRDTTRHNLVLILFDSLRRDHVPFHGYWRNTTPNIMRLVPGSMIFDQHITQAPWTKPSIASLFTSTYQANHNVVGEHSKWFLVPSMVTLAEVLLENGYQTTAVMENPHMVCEGFNQGFEKYYLPNNPENRDKLPALMADLAIETLDSIPPDKPFFLMMFFMNPHYPYAPKQGDHFDVGLRVADGMRKYDSEIYEADEQVGRVLDALIERGIFENTIIVFSSDHGEDMKEHGETYHGNTLYDTTLNVPLLVAGLGETGRFPGLVREIDLMPTLLDYLGVEIPNEARWQMAGISLRQLIEERPERTGLVAISETGYRDRNRRSERSEERKTIVDYVENRVEVYDLLSDPQELNDLVGLEFLRLASWAEGQWKVDAESPTLPMPEDVLKQLKAVGYFADD